MTGSGTMPGFNGVWHPQRALPCSASSFNRLARGRHRPRAAVDEVVLAKGVDLVALEFRVLAGGGQHARAAASSDFLSQFVTLFDRMTEELLQHGDDVGVAVIVVIEQDYVVRRLALRLRAL